MQHGPALLPKFGHPSRSARSQGSIGIIDPKALLKPLPMAAIKVYHYPGCSTCKKARRWLEDHDVNHELVHIVESPPSADQLRSIHQRSGQPLRKLFNTSGVSYREGDYKNRLPAMSDDEQFAALAADGKLIKRPLVVGKNFALIGFREDDYAGRLG